MNLEFLESHCRAELGRGHVARCPRGWLTRVIRQTRNPDLAEACRIALSVQNSGMSINARETEMRRLARRQLREENGL